MTELKNRVSWLEQKISTAQDLLQRDRMRLSSEPTDFAAELSAGSWEAHLSDLRQELRLTKEALRRELVEVRLFGGQVDNGSIPLRMLGKIATQLSAVVSLAAHHIRHGTDATRGVSDALAAELDLRMSGLGYGSSRMFISGNIAPDLTGESLLDLSLGRLFELVNATSKNAIHELVPVIGKRAVKELEELLGLFETQQIGASMAWNAPNDNEHRWGGSLQAVRTTRERLAQISQLEPEAVRIVGTIEALATSGRISVHVPGEPKMIRLRFPTGLYTDVQHLTLGASVDLQAMKYSHVDETTGELVSRYVLTGVESVSALEG